MAGTGIVIVVYLLANVVYLSVLTHAGLAATATPAAAAVSRIFGPGADRLISAVDRRVRVRVPGPDSARADPDHVRDGRGRRVLPALGGCIPGSRRPVLAIVVQAAWGIVLVLTGTYGDLVDSVVFGDWIFFGLTVAAVFLFRRRFPVDRREAGAFRLPGYPVVPALFVAAAVLVVGERDLEQPAALGRGRGAARGRNSRLPLLRPATEGGGMTSASAPYMEWAKSRPAAAIDLAGSNLLACSLEDLPGAREAVDIAGESPDGYPPLVARIAAGPRRRSRPGRHRQSAAPGANFLALRRAPRTRATRS